MTKWILSKNNNNIKNVFAKVLQKRKKKNTRKNLQNVRYKISNRNYKMHDSIGFH